MANIFTDLKRRYDQGNLLFRLVFINISVFVFATIWLLGSMLFNLNGNAMLTKFELPSNLQQLIWQPWTILTYMFMHIDFWHLLFNMLWLFWFGQMFLRWFTEKQLIGVYFMGGVLGGLLYVVAYNLFPYFSGIDTYLLGASASVLAIVVATAVRAPNESVLLMFLGAIKVKYIALFVVVLSFVNVKSSNAGGNISHLGGALFGYLFAFYYLKGKDLTKGFNSILDKMTNWFQSRPKMSVQMGDRQKDSEYNRKKKEHMQEIDQILDKMKRSGYEGLTVDEKKKLFNAGNK